MATSDVGRVLLDKAFADLKALRHMQDAFAFDEHIFGFLAQQACEKALKAWLLHLGGEPPFIHDLRHLVGMLADLGVPVPEADAICDLTKYAVRWRYEENPPDLVDRPAAVALCERLCSQVAGLRSATPGGST